MPIPTKKNSGRNAGNGLTDTTTDFHIVLLKDKNTQKARYLMLHLERARYSILIHAREGRGGNRRGFGLRKRRGTTDSEKGGGVMAVLSPDLSRLREVEVQDDGTTQQTSKIQSPLQRTEE